MDLRTMYETNFTIFIGIFVTLAVMGTTTLYDRYKSKGGSSFNLQEFKLFSDLSQKMTAFSSGCLKQFSEYSKKLSSSSRKKSASNQKKFGSVQKTSSKNYLKNVETIFLKAKGTIQNLSGSLSKKLSPLSSTLSRRSKRSEEKFVSLSNHKDTGSKTYEADKVNNLEKIVESKKGELDFDDDLLTKMSTSGTLTGSSPELKVAEPPLGEMSLDLDASFDNDFKLDENEFAIKVEGLDDEPAEDDFAFNGNSAEIKFGEDSDNLLASLKKEIVVAKEKKINFMDNMQGEDLDLKLMKSDLEGILKYLKKYRQFTSRN